jgi:imidazole glycerol phosphate synthase glutamine amidotransferase subunit
VNPDVVVLDYEMSNLRSAVKALERLGASVRVIRGPGAVGDADAVVLPGVGHFGEAMRRIRRQGLDEAVAGAVERGTPVLGICLGVQLLFEESEEAPGVAGLGVLPGAVRRLRTDRKLPHIGWSRVAWTPDSGLGPAPGEPGDSTYYFVHTFGCEPEDPSLVLGRADHGVAFCAAAGRPGLQGVQFHPEKSSAAGLALLRNFAAICASVPDTTRLGDGGARVRPADSASL